MEFTSVNKSTNNVPRTPITKDQFKALSDDDKKNYIGFLSSSYNVGSKSIAKMLGFSQSYLYRMMRDIGYNWAFIGKKTSSEYDDWDRFLEGNAPIESNVEILPNCYGNWERDIDKCLKCVHESECYIATPVAESSDCEVSMKMFIEECCKVNDDMNTRLDIFIKVYVAWCRDNEFPPMDRKDIIDFITEEYSAKFPKKNGHIYCNICLGYDKFQMYKNKIKYHDGEDRRTINPYMTFAKDNKEAVVQKSTKVIDEPKKNEDKPVVVESITKSEPKSMKMTCASGIFLFEGNGEDIFKDLIDRFKDSNLKVKISWELII